jgi:hypothetical protein
MRRTRHLADVEAFLAPVRDSLSVTNPSYGDGS